MLSDGKIRGETMFAERGHQESTHAFAAVGDS